MLLIDSLYINNSGGLSLLRLLVDEIEKYTTNVFYLIDSRCASYFNDIPGDRKCILKASMIARYKWYTSTCMKYDKILCFGNIPPPIKLECQVYTYFHNINLLNIPSSEPINVKLASFLKKIIFNFLKRNTNYWIVQTSNTQNELVINLKESYDRIKILPFYKVNGFSKVNINDRDGYIYASNYTRQKNFEFIVDCWGEMAEKGLFPTLHLTLSNMPKKLFNRIESAKRKGAKIVNHGHLTHDELFILYRKTKAIVYAATNESLGLCLIEAMDNGCNVIAPDLPYVHCICKPSCVFTIFSIDSFISALIKYEDHSSVTINYSQNRLNDLLQLLLS